METEVRRRNHCLTHRRSRCRSLLVLLTPIRRFGPLFLLVRHHKGVVLVLLLSPVEVFANKQKLCSLDD